MDLPVLYDALESRVVRFFVWLSLDFYEVMLFLGTLVFCYILYRLSESKNTEFAFEDLFTHGDRVGKADLFRLTAFGAFMAHTWVVTREAGHDTLSDTALWGYALIWSGTYVLLKGLQVYKTGGSLLPQSATPSDKPDEGGGK